MRKFLASHLTLTVALALAAGALPAAGFAADAIKIGVAGPHSGDLASYGIPTKDAAEMIV